MRRPPRRSTTKHPKEGNDPMLTLLLLGRAVAAPERLDRDSRRRPSEDGFTWWKAIFG